MFHLINIWTFSNFFVSVIEFKNSTVVREYTLYESSYLELVEVCFLALIEYVFTFFSCICFEIVFMYNCGYWVFLLSGIS